MSTGPLLLDGSAEGGVPADGGESGGAPAPPTLARVLETSHAQTAIAKAGSKAAKRDKIRVAGRFGHAVGEGTSRWRRARRELVDRALARRRRTWRYKVYRLLEGSSTQAKCVQGFLVTTIMVNILFFMLSTEPTIPISEHGYSVIETITIIIFTCEYIIRVWTICESAKRRYQHPVKGRLRWMLWSIDGIIDIVSIVPWFFEVGLSADIPATSYVRIFRVLRLLKTDTNIDALHSIWRVIKANREVLTIGLCTAVLLMLSTATLLYYSERGNDNDTNGNYFESIPRTLFLAILMLTGQGVEYDGKNYRPFTYFLISLTACFSVALFAIPAGMLAWGFESEAERLVAIREARERAKKAAALAGLQYREPESRSQESSSDEDIVPDAHAKFAIFKDDDENGLSLREISTILTSWGYSVPDATLLHTAHKLKCARGNVTYPQFLLLLSRLHLTAERERIASRRVRALSNNAGAPMQHMAMISDDMLGASGPGDSSFTGLTTSQGGTPFVMGEGSRGGSGTAINGEDDSSDLVDCSADDSVDDGSDGVGRRQRRQRRRPGMEMQPVGVSDPEVEAAVRLLSGLPLATRSRMAAIILGAGAAE